MRRFWNALPADGLFAIYDHSWYRRVLADRIDGAVSPLACERAYEEILEFERMLVEAGAVIVKFWMHIDREEQKRRFRRLTKHPSTAWKVGKPERRQHRRTTSWAAAAEEMFERTGTAAAPWTVVEATHARFARVKVFQTVVEAVEAELARRSAQSQAQARADARAGRPARRQPHDPRWGRPGSFADRGRSTKSTCRGCRSGCGGWNTSCTLARIPAVIAYEGWDAAGKGGNIRRLTESLDPRGYRVVPIAAPSREELAHHFLWRFWSNMPKAGHIGIFDRTWYGRVLVERVEGFCSEEDWKRSFREIDEFERQLTDFGTVLVKFWLQIDQRRAAPPLPGAAADRLQAMEDHRRRLAEPREVAAIRGGGARHAGEDQHQLRPLDDPGIQLQALRPHQGVADGGGSAGKGFGWKSALARVIRARDVNSAKPPIETRSVSEGKSFRRPRLRFGLRCAHE